MYNTIIFLQIGSRKTSKTDLRTNSHKIHFLVNWNCCRLYSIFPQIHQVSLASLGSFSRMDCMLCHNVGYHFWTNSHHSSRIQAISYRSRILRDFQQDIMVCGYWMDCVCLSFRIWRSNKLYIVIQNMGTILPINLLHVHCTLYGADNHIRKSQNRCDILKF